MAAEYTEITDSNHAEIRGYLDHVLTDLHLALDRLDTQGRQVAAILVALEEFRPLLDQFRSPLAAGIASRKARRNG